MVNVNHLSNHFFNAKLQLIIIYFLQVRQYWNICCVAKSWSIELCRRLSMHRICTKLDAWILVKARNQP